VRVLLPPPRESRIEAAPIPLDIIHEDDDLLVINKPPGVPVHPSPGHRDDTLVNGLLHHLQGRLSDIGGELRPGIVHRLDKDTSGVMLVAKNNEAHLRLAEDFARRRVHKVYEAILWGTIGAEEGRIEQPLGRSRWNRKKFAVDPAGREAITLYGVVDRREETTWVRLFPKTGRTHQLRVHMASIGHPILGDPLYGRKKRADGPSAPPYLALIAREISFDHPATGKKVTFTAPYPAHFLVLAGRLGYAIEGGASRNSPEA
jgi:23S rRNA pseudouridine1911/1915/1917 synthase